MLQYFENFKQYAFRLELLQEYSVEEEKESYTYFLKHGKILKTDNSARHNIILEAKKRGAKIHRVHCILFPISDYIKYELKAYQKNCKAGENICYIDLADYQGEIHHDFRLFDDEIVLKMNYDKYGTYIGFEIIDDIQPFIKEKERLLKLGKHIKNLQ